MDLKSLLKPLYNGSGSIVRITPDHYPMLRSWYEARGKRMPNTELLSDMGYIVDGRIAGWLYVTNSSMAMIEGIIADPATIPSLRKQSLRKLCGFLIDTALMLGFTDVFGISRHPSMTKISKEFGFKQAEFNIFTLSTGQDDVL